MVPPLINHIWCCLIYYVIKHYSCFIWSWARAKYWLCSQNLAHLNYFKIRVSNLWGVAPHLNHIPKWYEVKWWPLLLGLMLAHLRILNQIGFKIAWGIEPHLNHVSQMISVKCWPWSTCDHTLLFEKIKS